jgi:hypothetical protein
MVSEAAETSQSCEKSARRSGWRAAVIGVLLRPALWPEAIRATKRFARVGWWKQWPPLPLPPADYMAFRVQTNSGGNGSANSLTADDLVTFLKWGRGNRQVLK